MESFEITTGIWPKVSFEFKLDCLNIWTGELQKWPRICNYTQLTDQNDAKFSKTTQTQGIYPRIP